MLGDGEDQGGAGGGSALGGGGGKSEEGYRSSIFLLVLRIWIRDPLLFSSWIRDPGCR